MLQTPHARHLQVGAIASKQTQREEEILVHLHEVESNKLITRQLDITEATVKVHVKQLLKKLGLKTWGKLPCGR